jgi:hypothetical protein
MLRHSVSTPVSRAAARDKAARVGQNVDLAGKVVVRFAVVVAFVLVLGFAIGIVSHL